MSTTAFYPISSIEHVQQNKALGLSSNPKNKKEKRQAGNGTILYVPFFQNA
jgi:hypothetical protein